MLENLEFDRKIENTGLRRLITRPEAQDTRITIQDLRGAMKSIHQDIIKLPGPPALKMEFFGKLKTETRNTKGGEFYGPKNRKYRRNPIYHTRRFR